VFKIVGVLVIIFIIYQLVWTSKGENGSVFATAYNAVAHNINKVYESSRGVNSELLPEYGDSGTLTNDNLLTSADFDLSTGE
jgi:uncharacterized protein (UPF0333 family)